MKNLAQFDPTPAAIRPPAGAVDQREKSESKTLHVPMERVQHNQFRDEARALDISMVQYFHKVWEFYRTHHQQ
jgi:hypothetical protein